MSIACPLQLHFNIFCDSIKVACIILVIVVSKLPHAEFRRNDHLVMLLNERQIEGRQRNKIPILKNIPIETIYFSVIYKYIYILIRNRSVCLPVLQYWTKSFRLLLLVLIGPPRPNGWNQIVPRSYNLNQKWTATSTSCTILYDFLHCSTD